MRVLIFAGDGLVRFFGWGNLPRQLMSKCIRLGFLLVMRVICSKSSILEPW